jgi:hypothetical protein
LGEKLNWGLVTRLDNAYDGHEDVSRNVNCSEPLWKFGCGGEHRDYGDLISAVQQANLALSQQLNIGSPKTQLSLVEKKLR